MESAPVFLLLLLISLTLVQGLGTAIVPAGSSFVTALNKGNSGTGAAVGSMGIILNFVIIIFFFVQSLLIAQKMGIASGDAAVSMGNKLRTQGQRYLGNATFGAAGAVGRASVGQIAHRISESDGLKDTASKRTIGGWAARQSLKASRVAGDASFDARNVGDLGKQIGVGEGRKGGYKTVLGEIEKKEKEFATSLGEVGDDDVQVEARKKEWENAQRTQKAESVRLREDMKRADTPEARAVIQADIDELEKKEKDAHNNYEKEKQRRMIGSTFANEARDDDAKLKATNYDDAITKQKDTIKGLWKNYTELPKDADKLESLKNIKKFKDELDELKKKQREFLNKQGDQGYASVLESSKLYTAWPTGRLITHEREAGKAIRKSAEKGLPKKKDD